jgi:hypothetical protein
MARGTKARARKPGEIPPDFTPEVLHTLEQHLKVGLSWADASRLAGVGESTIHRWRNLGAQEGGALGEYVEALAKAKVQWKLYNLARVQAAAKGGETTTRRVTEYDVDGNVTKVIETTTEHPASWQAAAWVLERLSPAEFARVSRLDISTEDGADGGASAGVAVDGETVVSILDRIAARAAESGSA